MHKQTTVNKIYDPACGSGSLLLQAKKHFDAHIIEREITETITVKDLPKTQIWGGLTSSSNVSFGGSLSLITKNQRQIGLDGGLYLDDDKLHPYIGISYLWRIK